MLTRRIPKEDKVGPLLGQVSRGRYPIQSTVRPMVIIIHSPAIHNISRLSQAYKQFAIQTLISRLAVKVLIFRVSPSVSASSASLCPLRFHTHRCQLVHRGWCSPIRRSGVLAGGILVVGVEAGIAPKRVCRSDRTRPCTSLCCR